MENDKLTSFGNSFQSKIISSLLVKKTFLQTISDILQQEYFDSDANKWLVKKILDYFYEYKTSPTLEVIKVKINDVEDEVLKTSIVDKLKDAWNVLCLKKQDQLHVGTCVTVILLCVKTCIQIKHH